MNSTSSRELAAWYSIIIIGSGPAGLTLANLLGLAGIRVLLIERNASTVQEPRAVSIDDESLHTMQAIGIVEEVLAETVPGYGSHYYTASGRLFAKVEPTGTPYGYPRRNAFRQPILERQLHKALSRFPHVETVFGHTFESFTQDVNGVSVRVKGPGKECVEIRCDYLIGCDGASSTIRNLLGIPLAGSTFNERWLIVDLEGSNNPFSYTKVFCNPHRPAIMLPGPHSTCRFEFMLHSYERDEDLLKPEVVQDLLNTYGAAPHSVIVRKVVYRFHARLATHWSKGRVFLAGDAAHLTPPFAGQGMNSGIRDAYNLAWKLEAVIQGRIGPGLLDTYEQERRAHAEAMIQLALQMGVVMAPHSLWSAWAIQGAFRVLSIYPAARDYIEQMKFKPKPRFLSGFIMPDNQRQHRTLVGRLFPQPHVLTQDNRNVLLDTILGNEFTLVARSSRPDLIFATATDSIWNQLQARRLAILPQGTEWCALPGVTMVRELDQTFAAVLADYPDHFIVLRPDHYVMACIQMADIMRGSDAVSTLFQRTWTATDELQPGHVAMTSLSTFKDP